MLAMPSDPPRFRILILGGTGGLGKTLLKCWSSTFDCVAPPRSQVDLSHPDSVSRQISHFQFDAIINCAAIARPDTCEEDPDLAQRVNAESPARIAEVVADRGAQFIQISTDLVFAGDGNRPLSEDSPANPINVYGETKRRAEIAVLESHPTACVARVSWLFGSHKESHPDQILRLAQRERKISAVADKWSIPTHSIELADWLKFLLVDPSQPNGIFHLTPSGAATWFDWTQATLEIGRELGLPIITDAVEPVKLSSFDSLRARRPPCTVMSNARFSRLLGYPLSDWREGLRTYLTRYYRTDPRMCHGCGN